MIGMNHFTNIIMAIHLYFIYPHTVIEKKIDFTSYNIPKTNKLRLLFVGADYYPNVQGIEWFIHNVISEIDTISELNIIGKNMQKYAKMI